MQPFTTISGIAAPLLRDNINTDQITPVLPLRVLDPDYATQLFSRWRRNPDSRENADFVLNIDRFKSARILVAGRNFGCGSARESSVWSIAAFGFRCIVARSFADLFRNNCIHNGILPIIFSENVGSQFEAAVLSVDGAAPFTVDLARQHVLGPDGAAFAFEIDAADRAALLEGLDDVGLTLKHADDIAVWERRCQAQRPWLQTMVRTRA
jgi:3-isopropylmalate/(R)-2-methylmalate dehydratase small subunit